MSSVDNRIVEMQFNNRRFEQNARETMSTLDKLKEKLSFRDSTRELEEFQNASDSFNLSRIANAVDGVGEKFTLLGQIGYQAMQRIASAALDVGTNLLKSISVDQISAGMSKYEQETNIVQTLYSALKPKGKSLQDIYDVMELLQSYSDETSYSYAQMADGVSKFVAAGQDINKSETVMEGIANAAALAGVSIGDAQIAFRNFSDAMAKGYFQLQDWKSIQNIHMDTEAFKNEVLETAAALGKLKKDANGRYWITTGSGKNAKNEQITAANFSEYLRYGFFDQDVIMETMTKYADRMSDLGSEAFAAAQNAKTFTDVMDAVKDAASTGWSKSFRLIFGDVEEAIDLFTPMANKIIEVVNAIDDARNTMLQHWKDAGGRDSLIGFLDNLWNSFTRFSEQVDFALIQTLYDSFFPTADKFYSAEGFTGGIWGMMGGVLKDFTKDLQNAVALFNDWWLGVNSQDGNKRLMDLRAILRGVFGAVNIVREALRGVFTFVGEIFDQLKPTFDAVMALFADIGRDISGVNKDLASQNGFTTLAKNLAAMFKPLTSRLPKAINKLRQLYANLKKFWNENEKFVAFRQSVENLVNSFIKFVPEAIESIINFGKGIVDMVKNSDEWKALEENFNKYIVPWAERLEGLATEFNNAFSDFFSMDTSDEATLWGKIKKRFSAFEKLGPYLEQLWEDAKADLPWLQDVEDWWNSDPTINEIKQWVGAITSAIDTFLSADTSGETSIVGKIKARFSAMWDELGPWLEGKWNEYKEKWPILQQIEDILTNLFGGSQDAKAAAEKAGENGEEAVGILQQLWNKATEFVGKLNAGKVLTFAAVIWAFVKLFKLVKGVADWVSLGETIKNGIKDAIEGITTTIEDAHKTAKAKNLLTKAETLAAVAGSIWLMSDAMVKIAGLSWEEIGKGIAAMVVMMGAELGFMKLLDMINGGPSSEFGSIMGELSQGLNNLTTIIGMCASMLTLGLYLNMVSGLSWEQITNGLAAMVTALITEAGFLGLMKLFQGEGTAGNIINNLASGISNSAMLVTMSLNLLTIGGYLNIVAGLSWNKMTEGLASMFLALTMEAGFLGVLKLISGDSSFSNIISNLANGISNSAQLITLSLNLLTIGAYLNIVANISWSNIVNGLAAMFSALTMEAAFLGILKLVSGEGTFGNIMSNLSNAVGNSLLLGSLSLNLLTFGGYLKQVADLKWDQIQNGLLAMVGLFTGEGVLAWFLSTLGGGVNTGIFTAGIGALAAGTAQLADSIAKLGSMQWDELIKGFLGLVGLIVVFKLFLNAIYDLPPVKIGEMLGVVLVAGAMWIVADALAKLCQFNITEIISGITGMLGVAIVLWGFVKAMDQIEAVKITKLLSTIVVAIILAGLMVAFAFALSMVKDVDATTMLAFGGAMLLVGYAMEGLSKAINTLSGIKIGAAIKAIAIIGIAAIVIGAAVSLIISLVGNAIEGFAENIVMVGSYLSLYSDSVEGINYENVGNSVQMIKDMADAFVYVGSKGYGELETFKTNLTRMGGSIKLFSMSTAEVDTEKMISTTGALKQMAENLSGFPEVGDVSTAIGNIGGAIKLYSDSMNGVNLDEAPDSTAIQKVFETLSGAIPNDENLTEVASFASGEKGNEMTNFAIGLENIATAVSSFSESAKDLDFTNMSQAIAALDAIASLNDHFGTTTTQSISSFGGFSTTVTEQSGNLSTFAEDIVTLGTSLEAFGDNISKVKIEDLTAGADVLEKIAGINEKLPAEGGLSQWLSGSVSLTRFAAQLKLLGEGAKSFNDSIHGGEHAFDSDKVAAAGEALAKIADINAKLPKTGGISSWFTGDESLENFGSGLGHLGTGIAAFAEGFGDAQITNNMVEAVGQLDRIADVQAKLSNTGSWYNVEQLAGEIENAATSIKNFNDTLTGITWGSTEPFEHLLTFAVDETGKLADKSFSKTLKNIGTDLKDFFNEIWSFTTDWLGKDSGKLDKVTESVTSIFTTLNESFTNLETQNGSFTATGESILTALMNGFISSNSITRAEDAVTTLTNKLTDKVKSFTSKNQAFYNVGTWIPLGLAMGILGNGDSVVNAIVSVVNAGINAGMRTAAIRSPSRVFAEMGMYMDLGLAQGLNNYVSAVEQASSGVSQSAIDTVLQDMLAIQDLPLDDIDITPTIRPVLDTSDISNRAGLIEGILGGAREIGFNTRQLEAQAQILGDTTGADLSTITERVNALSTQLTDMTEKMTHLQIVLNNGVLVGAIESDIDRALGNRARLGERGG